MYSNLVHEFLKADITRYSLFICLLSSVFVQEDQDNFQACEQFILSNLLHGNYMSVDRNAVRRSMEGMILKLQVHNFTKEGQELDTLVKEFLASTDFKDYSTVHTALSM